MEMTKGQHTVERFQTRDNRVFSDCLAQLGEHLWKSGSSGGPVLAPLLRLPIRSASTACFIRIPEAASCFLPTS